MKGIGLDHSILVAFRLVDFNRILVAIDVSLDNGPDRALVAIVWRSLEQPVNDNPLAVTRSVKIFRMRIRPVDNLLQSVTFVEKSDEREQILVGIVRHFEEVLEEESVPFEEISVGFLGERLPPRLNLVEEDSKGAVLAEGFDVLSGRIPVDLFQYILTACTAIDGLPD